MKLNNAINKLKKNGFEITDNMGSFFAVKGDSIVSFFENGNGSNDCSRFTYDSKNSCAPTYGLNLKTAISFC